jgi:WD40 repeat protein
VTGVAIGVDAANGGRLVVASSSEDGTVWLWHGLPGRPVGVALVGHAGGVTCVALGVDAANGGRLVVASGGEDGTVRLWDAGSGRALGEPLVGHWHSDRVTSVALGVDAANGGRLVVASLMDGTVQLWDVGSGRPVCEPLNWFDAQSSVALGVDVAYGGRLVVASGNGDNMVQLWDVGSGRPLGEPLVAPAGLNRIATSVALGVTASNGGHLVVASGGDDGVVLWGMDSAAGCLPAHPGEPLMGQSMAVTSIALVDDSANGGGLVVASGGRDSAVRLGLGWPPPGLGQTPCWARWGSELCGVGC